MKKFLGAIVSAVAGILSFILLALDWCTVKFSVSGVELGKGSYTGWDLIEDKVDADGYMLYRIFAIVMLVVAVLLIIMAVAMLLKSLGVLKLEANLSFFNNILLVVFLVSIILAIVGLMIMRADIAGTNALTGLKTVCNPAIGVWLQLAVGVVACGLGLSLARKD